MAYASRSGMFVSSLELQVGLCPYVTAAVRGGSRSLRASRTWSQRPKFVQGSLESVEHLAPPSPPSLPRSFFAFWGFPECNTQDHPSLSWVCPWTIVRSWEHLPFLSLSLPLFLSFSFSLFTLFPGCPWMLRHSWEPFLLVCPWTHVS